MTSKPSASSAALISRCACLENSDRERAVGSTMTMLFGLSIWRRSNVMLP